MAKIPVGPPDSSRVIYLQNLKGRRSDLQFLLQLFAVAALGGLALWLYAQMAALTS